MRKESVTSWCCTRQSHGLGSLQIKLHSGVYRRALEFDLTYGCALPTAVNCLRWSF